VSPATYGPFVHYGKRDVIHKTGSTRRIVMLPRKTELRPWGTCAENLVKGEQIVFEISDRHRDHRQGDKTDRQTDGHLVTIGPLRSAIITKQNKEKKQQQNIQAAREAGDKPVIIIIIIIIIFL